MERLVDGRQIAFSVSAVLVAILVDPRHLVNHVHVGEIISVAVGQRLGALGQGYVDIPRGFREPVGVERVVGEAVRLHADIVLAAVVADGVERRAAPYVLGVRRKSRFSSYRLKSVPVNGRDTDRKQLCERLAVRAVLLRVGLVFRRPELVEQEQRTAEAELMGYLADTHSVRSDGVPLAVGEAQGKDAPAVLGDASVYRRGYILRIAVEALK